MKAVDAWWGTPLRRTLPSVLPPQVVPLWMGAILVVGLARGKRTEVSVDQALYQPPRPLWKEGLGRKNATDTEHKEDYA